MIQVDTEIRRAREFADYQACVDLQKKVWGFAELTDVTSLPILWIANRFGGCVLVAQEASGRFIGFSLALLAKQPSGADFWWSHMTAVISEYRNRDIGLRLKLRQREEALKQGVDEIRWTFDPLQSINGYFNVAKLGVVVRRYEENIYGVTSSSLHHGLPTDRFVAEWNLNSNRVKERIDPSESSVVFRDLDRIPCVNPSGTDPRLEFSDEQLLVEIPTNLPDLDRAVIEDWQHGLKAACRHYFEAGYAVVDFIKLDRGRPERAFYVLSRTTPAST